MAGCPYTWFMSFVKPKKCKTNSNLADALRVAVVKGTETTVIVTLPAHSARWLIDLIPEDVVSKIRAEGINLEQIQDSLAEQKTLTKQNIFALNEPHRSVTVWLE